MRFIDSTILSYAFYQNPHQIESQKVLEGEGITDSINLIEAFNVIENVTNRETAIKSIRAVLRSHLQVIPVDGKIVFEAMKRGQKYKRLRFIDLIHYTIALLMNCSSIVTYDKDFNDLEIPRDEI